MVPSGGKRFRATWLSVVGSRDAAGGCATSLVVRIKGLSDTSKVRTMVEDESKVVSCL